MITWQQLANFLPLLIVVFSAGAVTQRLRAVEKAAEKIADALSKSAVAQGRRIGNIESYLGLNADGVPVERLSGYTGRVRTVPGED